MPLDKNSEKVYNLLRKTIRAIQERSKSELTGMKGENFTKLSEKTVSHFERDKASGTLTTEFPRKHEKA